VLSEYNIIVLGRAYSYKAKNKSYQSAIKHFTALKIPTPLTESRLQVKIDYFFNMDNHRVDSDNLSKNVLDALKGVAYIDDNQVEEKISTIHDRKHSITVEQPYSEETFDYLDKNEEFLSIFIRPRPVLVITSTITSTRP
jgi:Holliday junction resolvase RusA-like endonuclease